MGNNAERVKKRLDARFSFSCIDTIPAQINERAKMVAVNTRIKKIMLFNIQMN